MNSIDEVLLALYQATTECGADDFFGTAMQITQQIIPFDSSGHTSLDIGSGHAAVLVADLYCEDLLMIGQWQGVNHVDPIMARAFSQVGRATAFNTRALDDLCIEKEFLHYMRINRHHQNGMVVINPQYSETLFDGLGFYRAHVDYHFSRAELLILETLGPHLLQAQRLNRRLNHAADASIVLGIFATAGQLKYGSPGLVALLRLEWPEWNGRRLPEALNKMVRSSGTLYLRGMHLEIDGRVHGDMFLVRARSRPALSRLSARELEAAKLFGAGMSNKEVARAMGVTPNTARNFIQRAYQKLEIKDKAALCATVGK